MSQYRVLLEGGRGRLPLMMPAVVAIAREERRLEDIWWCGVWWGFCVCALVLGMGYDGNNVIPCSVILSLLARIEISQDLLRNSVRTLGNTAPWRARPRLDPQDLNAECISFSRH